MLFVYIPVHAQEVQPEFSSAQTGERTVVLLPSNWTMYATDAEILLDSSALVKKVTVPDWWNATVDGNSVTLTMVDNVAKPSKFFIQTNSTYTSYDYEFTLNGTKYEGSIDPEIPTKDSKFVKWADAEENAATAFVPEEWSADLQIIRPYKSMTGYVFFARGSENTLVYVFHPFMPLHMLPSDSLCNVAGLCSSAISAEKMRELSLGNAPIAISDLKSPEEYFTNDIAPVLRRNLNAYSVVSEQPVYALEYGGNSTKMIPGHDVEYSFGVEGKPVSGRAMVFTRNYTSGDSGIWNGFIVGVESSEKNFHAAMKQALVVLLTLQFDEKWIADERNVLLDNVNATGGALGTIPELMANSTMNDFSVVVKTAAHKMARTYNDTMIAGYLDSDRKEELHLPIFPDLQHWYLNDNLLVGKKSNWNPMNSTSLEPLF